MEPRAIPAILVVMKHRSRAPEQADLLRPRLVDMIDGRHELVRLAALIDWAWFEREWAGFFPSEAVKLSPGSGRLDSARCNA